MENKNILTLEKNYITQFILRIDINPFQLQTEKYPNVIINHIMSKAFNRREKQIINKINFRFNNEQEVSKTSEEVFNYILINEQKNIKLTFSFDGAIIFHTTQYEDNSVYKDTIQLLLEAIKVNSLDIIANRIGMRYINEFPCSNTKNISKFFNKTIATNIKNMLKEEKISRAIAQEEYNNSYLKLKVQYGVPNKFYPAVINNYDLLLDIDSFDNTQNKPEQWEEVISELNNQAYNKFLNVINPKLIQSERTK